MAAFVARRAFNLSLVSAQRCLAPSQIPIRHISFSKLLSNRVYTEKHEWLTIQGNVGTVGISNHAQEQLGEIVYVETPDIGTVLEAEDTAGCLESVKAASDVYSPVAGEVTEVNEALESNPGLVNQSPLDNGWLYKMKVEPKVDTSGLMDEAAYQKFLENLEE